MPSSISTAVARPMRSAREFLSDTRATTSIEYALLASCVAVAVAAIVVSIGSTLTGTYKLVLDAYPS
jgi:Flp pilus assembly pilin Flp